LSINFDRIDIEVNHTGLIADSASIGVSNAIQPIRHLGKKGIVDQSPSGPITSSLSASYFMDNRSEPNLNIIDDIRNMIDDLEFTPAVVSLGGISGEGYLSRFSFNSYTMFNPLSGFLQSKEEAHTGDYIERSIAHGWGVIVETSSGGHLQDYIYDLSYEFQASWRPVYKIGNAYPIQVNMDGASEVISFTKDRYIQILYSGEDASGILLSNEDSNHVKIYDIRLNCSGSGVDVLNNNVNIKTFDLSGSKIVQEEISANVDDIARTRFVIQKFY
jgi:hypothetical protein